MSTCIKKLIPLHVLIAVLGLISAGQVWAQTLTTVHSFTVGAIDPTTSKYTNSDGLTPNGGLILSGNRLYGTSQDGGSSGYGTVFALNTDGTGFTNLHSFSPASDGANPYAGLILSGNALYGTTFEGGSWNEGTVFALNTNGTEFTNLYSFSEVHFNNSDGANPQAGLVFSGNTLYGTASRGGIGTVFALWTDGTGFTNLHDFVGSDGAGPRGLTLSGNTLYGTTEFGGGGGTVGAVFKINADGSGFTNLYSFTPTSPVPGVTIWK